MAKYAHAFGYRFLVFLVLLVAHPGASLKCRTEDGVSDAELKRVTRTCMRKIGESLYYSNSGSNANTGHHAANFHSHYGSNRQSGYGSVSYNSKYDYDDNDSNENDYNNRKNQYNNNNFDRSDDAMRQRTRERMQLSRPGPRSDHGTNSMGNRHGGNNGNNGSNGNNGNGGSHNYSGGGHGNSNGGNQRSMSSNGGSNNRNASGNDSACVVHCFFDEMNMLNQDDYPDRHKVQYILTKDIRERDLRDFYVDTIQQCFRYLESQRRREKCLYSRDLINCMAEYARGSCDDWQEFNMMFT